MRNAILIPCLCALAGHYDIRPGFFKITEKGVIYPPFTANIKAAMAE